MPKDNPMATGNGSLEFPRIVSTTASTGPGRDQFVQIRSSK